MNRTMQNISTKLLVLAAALLSGFYSLAQDQSVQYANSNGSATADSLSADAPGWYSNPVVWIAATLIIVVILVAAARSRSRRAANGVSQV